MGLTASQLKLAELPDVIAAAQAVEHDDTPAMNEIITRFEPLARRLARIARCPYLRDDLANAARVALVRAVRRHDRNRAGFPHYAERFMRGAVLRELRLWVARDGDPLIVTLDAEHEPAVDLGETLIDVLAPWGGAVVDATVSRLTRSQQQIATMRYVDDLQLGEIAKVVRTY